MQEAYRPRHNLTKHNLLGDGTLVLAGGPQYWPGGSPVLFGGTPVLAGGPQSWVGVPQFCPGEPPARSGAPPCPGLGTPRRDLDQWLGYPLEGTWNQWLEIIMG